MNRPCLWTRDALEKALGAAVNQTINSITGVSIDSRLVAPGDLFIALKGQNQNGHNHVAMAFEKGAVAAVVSDATLTLKDSFQERLIWVPDTQAALETLGRAGRTRSPAQVVAITGSVGKTGTKEALHHMLSSQGVTSANILSYNNQWGVPLSLARLPETAAYGIFEVGMNHPGEITPLTKMISPHVALITTVIGAHQEFFSSVEEIALAKAEIFQGLRPGGTAVLNRDNPYFDLLLEKARLAGVQKILSFGFHPQADIRGKAYKLQEESAQVDLVIGSEALSYHLSHPGFHWVVNSLAVVAVLVALEVPLESCIDRFSTLPSLKGRGQRHILRYQGKTFTLIDESYNANPASMAAALDLLGNTVPKGKGRRIAVLGDMRELGQGGPAAHQALQALLEKNNVDIVLTCGPLMAQLYEALPCTQQGEAVETAEELFEPLEQLVDTGDVIMVKGSNSVGLGKIVQHFVQHTKA